MTYVKRTKRATPDPELVKLADSLLANYKKPLVPGLHCRECTQSPGTGHTGLRLLGAPRKHIEPLQLTIPDLKNIGFRVVSKATGNS